MIKKIKAPIGDENSGTGFFKFLIFAIKKIKAPIGDENLLRNYSNNLTTLQIIKKIKAPIGDENAAIAWRVLLLL